MTPSPQRPQWQEVRPKEGVPLGERALAAGLVDQDLAALFRSGKAGAEVVSVVKAGLARVRELPQGPAPTARQRPESTWP